MIIKFGTCLIVITIFVTVRLAICLWRLKGPVNSGTYGDIGWVSFVIYCYTIAYYSQVVMTIGHIRCTCIYKVDASTVHSAADTMG